MFAMTFWKIIKIKLTTPSWGGFFVWKVEKINNKIKNFKREILLLDRVSN